MTALRVLRPGIHTTVQDAGREGYRALGVPRSGALDRVALRLVNALVENVANAPVLEMLYSGITVEIVGGSARVAIGCAEGTIERVSQPTRPLPAWRSALLHAGDRLKVMPPAYTAAAYLAVQGGYGVTPRLGSASTYVQGRLGGYEGRPLRAADVLSLALPNAPARAENALASPPDLRQPNRLRVMPGPQCGDFMEGALETLLAGEYRVSPASNRSGLRLDGPPLRHREGHDLLSEGVATGSIQVPGSGQPVVLIGDHPTVGGYPKIATIVSADWPAAGRLRIGSSVRFALANEADAAAARRAQRDWIANQIAGVHTVADPSRA